MISPQRRDRLLPCRVADMLNVPEVLCVAERNVSTANSAKANLLPRRYVQRQFPNTVRGGDRPGRGGVGVKAVQDFHQRRAMPGFAIEGAMELVNDEGDLGHGSDSSLCGSDIPVRRF